MSSQAEALQTTALRVSWWRALLGSIVALGGTVALFIPMVITFAVATDFKNATVASQGLSLTRAATQRLRGMQSRS